MPQLHFYVREETAKTIRSRARKRKLPVSKYLAQVVSQELKNKGWPEGFFENVMGSWRNEGITRPDQGEFEERAIWAK